MDGSVLAAWAGAAASLFGAGLTVWWPWHNRPQADWTLLEHSTNPELPISSTVPGFSDWLESRDEAEPDSVCSVYNSGDGDAYDVSIEGIGCKAYFLLLRPILAHHEEETIRSSKTDNMVFVVHGHDEGVKQTVARFLEQCGFVAVILHEQADGGRTIIEKIEQYADVVFAIVLYTPCDIGREKNEKRGTPRARQNVVFEHGYLIAKLGRERVCALVKQGVQTPGDIAGVVYKPMDSAGAWKTEILREMKSAGVVVDASKLL